MRQHEMQGLKRDSFTRPFRHILSSGCASRMQSRWNSEHPKTAFNLKEALEAMMALSWKATKQRLSIAALKALHTRIKSVEFM